MTDIAFQTATTLRALVARRELSPVEVVEAALERVERHNARINAVVTLNDRALDDARALGERLDRGEEPGPLCGIPVGIKDVTPVAGLRWTYGSPVYSDQVAEEDALVVRRLKRAGAVIIGKTNTPEFAAGGNTFNEVFGRTCNPWDPERSAGGSTGGGAAGLASGMIALAEGTDLGGSLRIPASFCGVVGLRPSPGLVPTYPSDWPWDTLQVTGPMARSAEDIALALTAIAGPSPLAPVSQSIEGRDFSAVVARGMPADTRIAYCPDLAGIGIDPGIEATCREAAFELEQAGAVVDEIELDLAFARPAFLALRGYWMVAHMRDRLEHLDRFGENLAGNIRAGLDTTVVELAAAERARARLWRVFRDLFERYDDLLTPCMAVPPFPVEENYPRAIAGKPMATYIDWVAPTFVLSLTGLPVAAVPAGLDPDGLPVGLQVVGPPRAEGAVLAVAKAVQDVRPIGRPGLESG